jgi:hypothetical protein
MGHGCDLSLSQLQQAKGEKCVPFIFIEFVPHVDVVASSTPGHWKSALLFFSVAFYLQLRGRTPIVMGAENYKHQMPMASLNGEVSLCLLRAAQHFSL